MAVRHLRLKTIHEHVVEPASPRNNSLEDLISSLIPFGRFQIINILYLCIPIIFNAFNSVSYFFTASTVEHRCNISQCDSLQSDYIAPWLNFTIPMYYGDWDQCEQYEAMPGIEGHCEAHHFNRSNILGCQEGYKFMHNENTISTEFEIFCTDQWKLAMVGTVSCIGELLGHLLGIYFADLYGRKTIIIAGGILSSLCGLVQSNAPGYFSFLVLECLNMLLSSTMFPTVVLLAMEQVNPNHRVFAVTALTVTNALAGVALGFIAGYFLDWRALLRSIYAPGLMHFMLICVLPESVRWLLSQSREEDAVEILRDVARVNQHPLCEKKLSELKRRNRQMVAQSKTTDGHYSIRQIFNTLGLRISLCSFAFFSINFLDLGLVMNLKDLTGDKFINYSLTSFMLLPGVLITAFLMNRIGRRRSICLFLGCCSILLVAVAILDMDYPDISWHLYMVSRLSSSCASMTLFFFTSELFPTNCRNSLWSLCGTFGIIGYMLAPHTPLLTKYFKYAPHLLFAAFALLNSGLVLYLPETANKVLPTTLEEARALDRKMPMKHPNGMDASKTVV